MPDLYAVPLIGALLASLILTPLSISLARRFGVLDPVDPRKIHSSPKPRWGGVGIVVGFAFGVLALWIFSPPFKQLLQFDHPIKHQGKILFTLNLGEQLAGICLGTMVLFVLGIFDDRRPVAAPIKLLVQIIAAYVAMTYGVRIYGLALPGFESYSYFPLWMMQVLTILWLVGMTNAINLIDGIDGLAAGVAAILAGTFLALTLIQESGRSLLYAQQMKLAGVVAAALFGGTLGFLVFNFYPARVFMGDSGSLSLGFLIGCIAVIGTFKTTILGVLLVPLFLVTLPVGDMIVSFVRRVWKKQNPFAPDRQHLHHRFLEAGWTQREVVLLVYVITLVLGLATMTIVGIKK